MPRISEIELEDLTTDTGDDQRGKRGDPTWERIAAHCPQQLIQIDALMRSFAEHGTMPRRYIEIAVVTVSRLNECRHCVGRHSVRLHDTGLTHDIIKRILDADCPGLDEKDRLVRDYARQVSENSATMRDVVFDELRTYFDEAQIVELTMRIGLAGFFNRFNNALQIELDEAHLETFLSQDRRTDSLPNTSASTLD
jgi:AhpD family alkylhydroperoxidase